MELLVWIGFLVIYLLFQALGRKNRRNRQKPVPGSAVERQPGTPSSSPATLEGALREIQAALTSWKQDKPDYERSRPLLSHRELPTKREEFRPIATRFEEETFEARPTYSEQSSPVVSAAKRDEPSFKAPSRVTPLDAGQSGLTEVEELRENVHRRLKDPHSVREAFVLGEILGKPASSQYFGR